MSTFITRSERAGNIFFRMTALIRSGQLQWADRPAWYDVYVAHPPLTSPDWNVKLPKHDEPVRKIFYEEDAIRAQFYKARFYNTGVFRMDQDVDTISQKFINEYQALAKEEPGLSNDEMMERTAKRLEDLGVFMNRQSKKETVESVESSASVSQ